MSNYIGAMGKKNKEKDLQQLLEKYLLEGIESGDAESIDDQFWIHLEQRITKKNNKEIF